MSEVLQGQSPDNVEELLKVCNRILVHLSPSHARNREKIVALLKELARDGDTLLVDRVLRAAQQHFRLQVNRQLHTSIVTVFKEEGHLIQAAVWLKDMPHKPGAITPYADVWEDLLTECIVRKQFTLFQTSMNYLLSDQAVKLKPKTYKIFLEALFLFEPKQPPTIQVVESLLNHMREHHIRFSNLMLDVLIGGYRKFRQPRLVHAVQEMHERMNNAQASQVESTMEADDSLVPVMKLVDTSAYVERAVDFSTPVVKADTPASVAEATDSRTSAVPTDTPTSAEATGTLSGVGGDAPRKDDYTANILKAMSDRGEDAARVAFHHARRQGFVPTPETLDALAPYITSASALYSWESLLQVTAGVSTWVTVIRNIAAYSVTPKLVINAYFAFLSRGLIPSPDALYPVLHAICSSQLRAPKEGAIANALKMLRSYVLDLERHAEDLPEYSPQSDLPLYDILLRALTTKPKHYHSAISLLEEMQRRGIAMDPKTRGSIIPLFLRIAPDASAAFGIYRQCCRYEDGKYALTELGFHVVLDLFCKLWVTQPEHVDMYMAIMSDLRAAGFPVNVKIYTHILRKLSMLAVQDLGGPSVYQDIAAAVKRVHNAISLDPSLTPDLMMWNQLMDAYQRAGFFKEAYTIWESLLVSRSFDNVSVSIILDACSHAGADKLTIQTFAKLHASGFPLNQKNWNNWLEALCRVGRVSEATKVLCIAIPAMKSKEIKATVEMARMILKFATELNQQAEVRQRIKYYLPDVYPELL